jgi:hypothetical protein
MMDFFMAESCFVLNVEYWVQNKHRIATHTLKTNNSLLVFS